jgi:hypothetical protein
VEGFLGLFVVLFLGADVIGQFFYLFYVFCALVGEILEHFVVEGQQVCLGGGDLVFEGCFGRLAGVFEVELLDACEVEGHLLAGLGDCYICYW